MVMVAGSIRMDVTTIEKMVAIIVTAKNEPLYIWGNFKGPRDHAL
jgi:hypothetical protein